MAAKALSNQMSRIVRVNRIKLLEVLTANREKHIAAYDEAMAGYREMALAKIDEAFQGLNERMEKKKAEIIRRINTFTPETAANFSDWLVILDQVAVNLKVPVSYSEAYDAAIDIAKYDTRDELELTGAEFQCFFRDVWDWTHEFSATNMHYAAVAKKAN